MAIELTVSTQITVPSVAVVQINKAVVSKLVLNFDKTEALLQVNYMDDQGVTISTRHFKVCGLTYANMIGRAVSGNLAEIVIGLTANFALQVISNPAMIDGVDIIELDKGEFMSEIRNQ